MLVYIVLYFLAVIFCILETNAEVLVVKGKKLLVSDVSWWVLSGYILTLGILRGEELGVDSIAYKNNYWEVYKNIGLWEMFQQDSDWGYGITNWIIGRFVSEYWIFRAILFSVTFILITVWIRKHSKNISLSFLVYLSFGYLGFEFAILRQALAVSVFVWSYDFLIERKPVKFAALIFVAVLCHRTAIFMLLEYPLLISVIKKGKKIAGICYFWGAIVLTMLGGRFITFFYQRNDYSHSLGEGGWNLLLYCIFLLCILGYFMKKIKYDRKIESEFCLAVSIVYFQIIALAVSVATRILMYPVTYLFVLMPDILDKADRKARNEILFILFLLLTVLFLRNVGSSGIVPYATWFLARNR